MSDVDAVLRRAIYKAGLALEQRGKKRVKYRVRQGVITLRYAGHEIEVGDVDAALEQIEIWGTGKKWRPGEIVLFVKALNKLLAKQPMTDDNAERLREQIDAIADEHDLFAFGRDPSGLRADAMGEVYGYYSDDNEIIWCVYLESDSQARYVRAKALAERPRPEDELPDL